MGFSAKTNQKCRVDGMVEDLWQKIVRGCTPAC